MNFKPQMTNVKTHEHGHFDGMPTNLGYEPITKYMTTEVITFHPEQAIYEVINIMLKHKISGAPVLNDDHELVGVISEKDCLRVIIDKAYNNLPVNQHRVKDLMSTSVQTVSVESDVVDLANTFLNSSFKRFPVVDAEGKLVGQISRSDVLRAARNIETTTW